MSPRILVMLPTYNERENILPLLDRIFGLGLGLEAVVVDDKSPDGTGELVRNMARRRPGLHLIERPGPRGRGLAGREGYLFALSRGVDYLVEMDADFSHEPRHIPELLAAVEHCDVVLGSRFVPGGGDAERSWRRRVLTRAANAYARLLLGLEAADCNSGFRCFSRRALQGIHPETMSSRGPSIVHEALYRAHAAGLRIKEVPIEFAERRAGATKLDLARLLSGLWWIARLRLLGFKAN
ncbi:MAG: polyprenol monophosphomannose synthase [Elusimicrobia bacterium]|nr:polyprenol monophosphomannose synthase [Elusimicrobiota bacterium]